MEIKFIDRENSKECIEKVYGDKAIELLYETSIGKMISGALASKLVSQVYGGQQDSAGSKKKIKPFIENYSINMDEFLPEEGRSESDPYSSFNQFFIRRFREGKRNFSNVVTDFSSPCEARYFAYDQLTSEDSIPVKGSLWDAKALLKNDDIAKDLKTKPALLARLCPIDYHRFHFPDSGKVIESYPVHGAFTQLIQLLLRQIKIFLKIMSALFQFLKQKTLERLFMLKLVR